MLDRDSARSMCVLGNRPVCCYHAATGHYIVYWQGVVMTRAHAMMIVQEKWVNSWATPHMKECAFIAFKQAYVSGAFGNVNWTYMMNQTSPDDYMARLRKWVMKHDPNVFKTLVQNYTLREAMLWFSDPEVLIDG